MRDSNGAQGPPIADAAPPPSTIAGLASGRMYKVTKIDDKRLNDFVGKRVEVTGTIKPDHDVPPGERPANLENLPNLEGTSIHEVTGGTCPARPL